MSPQPSDINSGCLIVTGMPGAGKTTVTKLIATSLSRAARIDGDAVAAMIVSGHVGPASRPKAEANRQLWLRAENICDLANNFAAADFTPIVDHVIPDEEVLSFMVERLRPRPLMFVVLAPSLGVCRVRNDSRAARYSVPYDFSFLDAEMRESLGDLGWWVDSAGMSPEATASLIQEHAADRAVIAR